MAEFHGLRAVARRRTESPRTALAFFGVIAAVVLSAAVGGVGVLAGTRQYTSVIPWILILAFVFIVALTVAVFIQLNKDPSKLMLGQVSGTEYADIQRTIVLGDSRSGERAFPAGRGLGVQQIDGQLRAIEGIDPFSPETGSDEEGAVE